MVAATQNAQEIERKRRLVWEQEQEAKFSQRQADMEKKMSDMLNELTTLRTTVNTMNNPTVNTTNTGLVTPQYSLSPALSQQTTGNAQLTSPISPVPQPTYPPPQPMFVEGSSSNPLPAPSQGNYYRDPPLPVSPPPLLYTEHTFQVSLAPPPLAHSLTPDPSPQMANAETSDWGSTSRSSRPGKRKKRRSPVHSSEDEGSSSSSSSSASSSRPRKRKSHHDSRCYTIHVSFSSVI